MTIGKKLYMNFGIILVMVVVLFGVNWLAVQREHTAKAAAATSLELQDTTTTGPLPDDAEPALPEQLPAQRRHARSRPHERRPAHPEREAGAGQRAGQLRSGEERSGQGAATGAGLGQGIFPAADRQAQRRRLRQRHRRRTADLLPPERRFLVGEELDRRARCSRRRKPQVGRRAPKV